jgi:hypothetical protein
MTEKGNSPDFVQCKFVNTQANCFENLVFLNNIVAQSQKMLSSCFAGICMWSVTLLQPCQHLESAEEDPVRKAHCCQLPNSDIL